MFLYFKTSHFSHSTYFFFSKKILTKFVRKPAVKIKQNSPALQWAVFHFNALY